MRIRISKTIVIGTRALLLVAVASFYGQSQAEFVPGGCDREVGLFDDAQSLLVTIHADINAGSTVSSSSTFEVFKALLAEQSFKVSAIQCVSSAAAVLTVEIDSTMGAPEQGLRGFFCDALPRLEMELARQIYVEPLDSGGASLLADFASDAAQIRPRPPRLGRSENKPYVYADAGDLDEAQKKSGDVQNGIGDVNIAFIDTGVDLRFADERLNLVHWADFSGAPGNVRAGSVPATEGDDPVVALTSASGRRHGTYAALIAAGKALKDGNGRGAAPGAGVFDLRVPRSEGNELATDRIIAAIHWIEQWNRDRDRADDIHIVNMSFGNYQHDPDGKSGLATCADWLTEKSGALVVAGFGNCKGNVCDGSPMVMSPASSRAAISVAGMNGARMWDRKNYTLPHDGVMCGANGKPDITASDHFETDWRWDSAQTYQPLGITGTSFSAAFVSGAAAILLARDIEQLPGQIKNSLISAADQTLDSNALTMCRTTLEDINGAGLINVYCASAEASNANCAKMSRP